MADIYKLTEYDLLATAINNDNYYICTDSKKMYKDYNNQRSLFNVTLIDTELDRINFSPTNGTSYYIWETNELWLYNGGWIIIVGQGPINNAYFYTNDIITGISGTIIDNNGLLQDGSVVIRDINRIIKGRLLIDTLNNNLIIASFLGGGITLLPSGTIDERGSFIINATKTYDEQGNLIETEGKAVFKGDMYLEHIINETSVESKVLTTNDIAQFELEVTEIHVVTDDYVVTDAKCTVICNKATSILVSLPNAVVGMKITIKNINDGIATVESFSTNTIDNELNQTLQINESITVFCYETNKWVII